MTPDEYQQKVMRTCGPTDPQERLKMALIGLQDELGEVAGPIKKYLWHGHPLEQQEMINELGDVTWYLALLCSTLELSLEGVMEQNIRKLEERFPEGFDEERSRSRED